MMQPGMMMGQMALPPSQTWSGGNGAPPPPMMSRMTGMSGTMRGGGEGRGAERGGEGEAGVDQ